MTIFDDEMMKALEADGEYLRQMTGEDHGPYFFDAAGCVECGAALPSPSDAVCCACLNTAAEASRKSKSNYPGGTDMKSSVSVSIDKIAEQISEDETGELMASLLAGIIREFEDDREGFGKWMQSAMNDARYLIPQSASEEWADRFIVRIEIAALHLD